MFPKIIVIIKNIINNIVTEINDEIVFLFVLFKKKRIIILIIRQIMKVGIIDDQEFWGQRLEKDVRDFFEKEGRLFQLNVQRKDRYAGYG